MDLTFPAEAQAFRERLRRFLRDNLPPGWAGVGALDEGERLAFGHRWRALVSREGLLAVAWPREYGGAGLGPLEQFIVAEEFIAAGVPVRPLPGDQHGLSLIGPTILQAGTEQQKQFFIPKILSGEHRWAQGYSEPEAGSDLASLRTRAVLRGAEWVINGQETWQTAGDAANWIFVLARTDAAAAKHAGLSLLLLPIDQPGVEVRPIRTLTGHAEFCEFFFTDASASVDHVIGGVNNGWKTAMPLLSFERSSSAAAAAAAARVELDRLAELIRQRGRANHPLIPAVEAMGLTGLTPRGLRHTAASLAIASGADVKVVQTMFGHASATMTLDLYGDLYADRLDEIADRMDAARTARLAKSRTSAQDHADFCGLTAS